MTEIPTPPESGSDGSQELSNEILSVTPKSPIEGLPIATTVNGLAATKPRSMGGDVAAQLLAGSFTQISHELQEAKQEVKNTQKKFENVSEHLSRCNQRAAVLEEKVRANAQNRHLKNLSLTAGTALIGIAIEFSRNNMDNFSYITGGLGALLLLMGWFNRDVEATS